MPARAVPAARWVSGDAPVARSVSGAEQEGQPRLERRLLLDMGTEPGRRRAGGAVDRRRHGRVKGERDLAADAELMTSRGDRDVLGADDEIDFVLEGRDFGGQGRVVGRELGSAACRSPRVTDLPGKDDDDPDRQESGRDPADPAPGDAGDRQPSQVNAVDSTRDSVSAVGGRRVGRGAGRWIASDGPIRAAGGRLVGSGAGGLHVRSRVAARS